MKSDDKVIITRDNTWAKKGDWGYIVDTPWDDGFHLNIRFQKNFRFNHEVKLLIKKDCVKLFEERGHPLTKIFKD